MFQRGWNSAEFSDWSLLSGFLTSDPDCVGIRTNEIACVVRGPNDELFYMLTNGPGILVDWVPLGGELIDGAAETLEALREAEIPFRFITNTTTRTQAELMEKLDGLGLSVEPEMLFTAVTATRDFLAARGRPNLFLLVRESVKDAFSAFPQDERDPDYVVIGDIGAKWDYETLNDVFNMLMRGAKLLCMHRNKYWQDEGGMRMDIGAFVAALEHVSGKEAVVVGKPSSAFLQQAVSSLGLKTEEVAVVGDDIESDVGGGQASGLTGILVKTGKYREELVRKSSVEPDAVIDSIADLPALLGL